MLDITFYTRESKEGQVVEVSEEFYQLLIKSDFSKIGKSEKKNMTADEEPVEVDVVLLEGENRRKLSDFFRNAIVEETDNILSKLDELGDSPSSQEYKKTFGKFSELRKLQELRKCVENEEFKYLGRTE
ncbi:hypothetical protein NWP22_07145 [Anabaenopsis tanganyikae CS-531]|uniref:Uncharacterized protein n=1 Tax=Anabaenopsis tanganyikae CS-531 TaxID=2785304 RepID=A0ABT6KCQ0_9CYAN|nr:hypothetical protein [Anabaenopsis tanganyikae]MDH6105641.1 hypothetical protein [Anabaenopsis tanganyikae CS-531]